MRKDNQLLKSALQQERLVAWYRDGIWIDIIGSIAFTIGIALLINSL